MDVVNIFAVFLAIVIIVIVMVKPKNENKNSIKSFIEKNNKIIFFIILVVAILLRIVVIQDCPKGMHIDEAGMAYDAMSMAEYGVDRGLNKNPVYLTNFGGGQSALYMYITAIFIKIFGYSIFIIRLPAILFSIGGIIAAYFLVKEHRGKAMALTFMFMITVAPWEIMKARWGLDCNLLSSMLIISILVLSKAVIKQKGRYFVLAGISFGITLYTYAMAYIILPLFLLITFIYLLLKREIKFKQIIFFGLGIILFAIPLILMILVNNNIINEIKTDYITIPKLPEYRQGEMSISNIKDNFYGIFKVFYTDPYIYSTLPDFGTVYKFSFVFLCGGICIFIERIYRRIRLKERLTHCSKIDIYMLFAFISCFICGILTHEPNINRLNAIYIPMIYFIVLAIYYILQKRKELFLIIISMYIVFTTVFLTRYFEQKSWNILFNYKAIELIQYVEEKFPDTSQQIYIEKYTIHNQPYIYVLIANEISPYEFSSEVGTECAYINSYGRYNFYVDNRDIDELFKEENAIYITKKSWYLKPQEESEYNIEEFAGFYYIIHKK